MDKEQKEHSLLFYHEVVAQLKRMGQSPTQEDTHSLVLALRGDLLEGCAVSLSLLRSILQRVGVERSKGSAEYQRVVRFLEMLVEAWENGYRPKEIEKQ